MIGDNGQKDEVDLEDLDDDILDDDELSEDEMPDIGGDTILDLAGELQAEEFASKAYKSNPDEVAHRREVRRRLEEIAERRNADLDNTFNFDLDDDF